MIIQSRIEGKALKNRSVLDRSLGAIGVWSVAILCGSIVAACSGTIETPTEEFPPRQGGSSQAQTEDDDDSPRAPASTPSRNPPVAANDDEDDPPVAPPADDEEDPPADDPPADDPPADDPPAAELSFETDIFPIFSETCGPCHAGGGAPNDLAGPDVETAFEAATSVEDRVFARIDVGTMPPPCAGGAPGDPNCISVEDLATLEAWYDAGAPE
jgi:hypothetical protein